MNTLRIASFQFLSAVALVLAPGLVLAAGTAANTPINNFATATYKDPANVDQTETSNTVTVTVDEILNVTIADGGNVAVITPEGDRALAYTVTNTGNGSEGFELTAFFIAAGSEFDPTAVANDPRIFIESNGTAGFQAGVGGDTLYTGPSDLVLAADGTKVVYFVSNIPSGLSNGDDATVQLRATAETASADGDNPGTVFAAFGDGGTDAVVGTTRGSARDQASYLVSAVSSTLVKSVVVENDPVNGTHPVPGATLTYTLLFTLTGSGDITGAKIVDNIPAGTSYKPNSITLEGAAVADGTGFLATPAPRGSVSVDLASPLSAPATRTVTFQVTIDN